MPRQKHRNAQSRRTGPAGLFPAVLLLLILSGCYQLRPVSPVDTAELTRKARMLLIDYTTNESPLLRSHAIEALAESSQVSAAPFILAGFDDQYWGVRFSACLAVLKMHYKPAEALLVNMVKDRNLSVRAAGAGALHVLGDQRYTSVLGTTLFDEDSIVRRNTAMVFARMGDPAAVKLLKKVQRRDEDLSVRIQVTEAMAVLGNKRAQRVMLNYCRSAYDDEVILAMLALARAKCVEATEQIAYVYDESKTSQRLGMRLVAARALAALDDYRGRRDALNALRYRRGPADQSARIRKLGALALAEIADPENLAALKHGLNDPDGNVRIATALAILKSNSSSEFAN